MAEHEARLVLEVGLSGALARRLETREVVIGAGEGTAAANIRARGRGSVVNWRPTLCASIPRAMRGFVRWCKEIRS
jgi:hypothetical protein